MPIRINLLSEAQAAEEQRRKDPVKRAIIAAAGVVVLVGLWAGSLQLKLMSSKSDLVALDARWKGIAANYREAVDSQYLSMEAEQKLVALQQLTTNRFLWGNVLNAIQQTVNGVDDLQMVRFKSEQVYLLTEGTPAKTNNARVTPGTPGSSTERIVITLDATDSSAQPGARVTKFKENIGTVPYFASALQKTNGVLLTSLSAPQISPGHNPFVLFTLQCYFPEKVR